MRAREEVEGDCVLSTNAVQMIRTIRQSRLGDIDIVIDIQDEIGAQNEKKTGFQELRPRWAREHVWIFGWTKYGQMLLRRTEGGIWTCCRSMMVLVRGL
jgi:hypothetical protein